MEGCWSQLLYSVGAQLLPYKSYNNDDMIIWHLTGRCTTTTKTAGPATISNKLNLYLPPKLSPDSTALRWAA